MDERERCTEELFRDNYAILVNMAYKLLHDRDRSEDMVQSAFTKFAERFHELADHPDKPRWLAKTVYFNCMNELRLMSNTHTISLECIGDVLPAPPSDTVSEVLPAEIAREDSVLLKLRYELNLSYRDISEITGESEAACRVKMHRARRRCREILKKT